MTIIFRKPTTIEEEIIAKSLQYWLNQESFDQLKKKFFFIIGEGNWKEVFITNKQTFAIINDNEEISPYSVGLGIGEIKNKEFRLSLSGGSFISKYTNKTIIINLEAEQLFLFSRNIHSKSVMVISDEVSKNDKVLLKNTDNDYLGLGKLVLSIPEINDSKNKDHVAVKNIIDLGWYLRKGK